MTKALFAAALAAASFMPLAGAAHNYQSCMEVMLLDCSGSDDPLGICRAQANAFCSNHHDNDGGGVGNAMLDLDFAIDDGRDGFLSISGSVSVKDLNGEQMKTLRTLLQAELDFMAAKARRDAVRMQMRTRAFDDSQ